MTSTDSAIRVRIRQLRLIRGMSLNDLQEATGIHYTWLSRIETGKATPTDEELAAIKSALAWPAEAERAFAILEGAE